MEMTKAEIARSYREAADKLKQLTVLAQLNCVPRDKIIRILIGEGEDLHDLPAVRGRWKVDVVERIKREPASRDGRGCPRTVLDEEALEAYTRKREAVHQYVSDNNLRMAWIYAEINKATGAEHHKSRISKALSLQHPCNRKSSLAIVDVACGICGIGEEEKHDDDQ